MLSCKYKQEYKHVCKSYVKEKRYINIRYYYSVYICNDDNKYLYSAFLWNNSIEDRYRVKFLTTPHFRTARIHYDENSVIHLQLTY